jgi:TonB-dependent SusC/RagA subfamily outer membrane receptor
MRLMPLLIVDGQVRAWDFGQNTINTLRPEDISNIDVLKGDKAVALYGVEAREGVVVISTKAAQKR